MTGQIVRGILRAAGSSIPVSLSSYSVVGAAAFMGGATRLTLTATVMVMETTGALQLIVPIMLTVFVAKVKAVSTLVASAPLRPGTGCHTLRGRAALSC